MEKVSLLGALRRHWLLAITCFVLVLGATVAATRAVPRTYAATLQAYVSAKVGDARVDSPYQGSLLAQSQVQSLAAIVSSPPVTDPVIRQLRLNMRTDQLAAKISTNVPMNTVLINVTVQDGDPNRARDIANAVGVQFSGVVSRLDGSAGISPVGVVVIKPATPPTSPVSPRPLINYLLGAMVGLALGAAAAMLRASRSRRKKAKASSPTGPGSVVTLAQFPQMADSEPLAVIDGEAVKQLRVSLALLGAVRRHNSILVTAPGVGEGRSTTCLNLAANLAETGLTVAVVEADTEQASISSCLGIDGTRGLMDVLDEHLELVDTVRMVHPRGNDRLLLLPHGLPSPGSVGLTAHARFPVLLRQLERMADVVLVDAPVLRRDEDVDTIAALDRPILLVSRRGRSRQAAEKSAQALVHVGANVLGVVENWVPTSALAVTVDVPTSPMRLEESRAKRPTVPSAVWQGSSDGAFAAESSVSRDSTPSAPATTS